MGLCPILLQDSSRSPKELITSFLIASKIFTRHAHSDMLTSHLAWVCRSPSPAPQSKAKARAKAADGDGAELPPPPKRSEAAAGKESGKVKEARGDGKDADDAMPDAKPKAKAKPAEAMDVDKDTAPKVHFAPKYCSILYKNNRTEGGHTLCCPAGLCPQSLHNSSPI